VRCNEIQGAQGVENAEATSLASGRNIEGSDARYFFADALSIFAQIVLQSLFRIIACTQSGQLAHI